MFRSNTKQMQEQHLQIQDLLAQKKYEASFHLCQQARQKWGKVALPEILYSGSCALFGLGHINQAREWVDAYARTAGKQTSYLYLAAYLSLHHGQTEQALLHWTSILRWDPSQTFADQLIERIKRGEKKVLHEIAEPRYFSRYVPLMNTAKKQELKIPLAKPHTRLHWRIAFLILLSILLTSTLSYFYTDISSTIKNLIPTDFSNLPKAPTHGSVLSKEQMSANPPRFLYNSYDEAINTYRKARNLISNAKVNQGRLLLGRLELSNISFEAKERTLLLRASIPFLSYPNFNDPLSIDAVHKEPYIYRGAQILWEGSLRALRPHQNGLELELVNANHKNIKILAQYIATSAKRKELITKLNVQNKVRIFGIFSNLGKKIKSPTEKINNKKIKSDANIFIKVQAQRIFWEE